MTKFDNDNIIDIARKVFNDEINGLKDVSANINKDFANSVNVLLACTGKIVVTGVGKSGHIAKKIAATLASTGSPAFFMHPTEALHGDLGMISNNDTVIAISYSGEAEELTAILTILKRRHIPIVGVTGNIKSSLAKLADHTLHLNILKEACPLNLAPTTSTTATLVLGDAIAISLLTLRGFKEQDFAMSHPGGSLGRKLLTTNRDIMHSGNDIPQVGINNSLKEIVLEISKKGLGFTAVINELNKVVGVITDGDLRRILDSDSDFKLITANSIMTKNPKVVYADNLAINTVELMEHYKITGFLVVDADLTLVGAFNLHDLFKAKLL